MAELDDALARARQERLDNDQAANERRELRDRAMDVVRRYCRSLEAAGRDDQRVRVVRRITEVRTPTGRSLWRNARADEARPRTFDEPAGEAWYVLPGQHKITKFEHDRGSMSTFERDAALLYVTATDTVYKAGVRSGWVRVDSNRVPLEPSPDPLSASWVIESVERRENQPDKVVVSPESDSAFEVGRRNGDVLLGPAHLGSVETDRGHFSVLVSRLGQRLDLLGVQLVI
jgi:hypothetical protein